ncbi:AarF/ABC1/UbiB kinase family protein [Allohahella marinimesophila]|uniref:AarF/ABC1/UbiB kinase family protein n=1 Tax=Allohahella marinimesophila TaxID=1054972 RepID=A0ABP7PQX0_9GAMM
MTNDKDSKPRKSRVTPVSRTRRFFKLAGMTASVAGNYAGQKIRRQFTDEQTHDEQKAESYDKMAARIVDTLGELKGAVMKVGQVASQTQDFLPKEFSKALQRLQKEAPPMDFDVIAKQIEEELGASHKSLFATFDEEPYAAASIGQVHRATTREGQDVIVKVQYPGVGGSVDSDLKQLRLALKLGGLLKMPKESVDQLFAEIRARLVEELDYENEARNVDLFRGFHKDEPKVLIPAVLPGLSSRRVLTMEYVAGDHVSEVTTERYYQTIINEIGELLFRTMADQLFRFKAIHGDPHAGNFAFRPDGTLIIYDFGCVKKLKPEIVEAYRKSVNAALAEDYAALDRFMIDLGVRVEEMPAVDEAYYALWRDIIIQPFSDETYDFKSGDVHLKVAAKSNTVFKHLASFKPPVETLFIDRMIAGHYWIMKGLGVQAAFKPLLDQYLKTESS